MLNRIKRLIIKEFLSAWRDPRSRVVLIVPPLIQMVIFSFAATHEVRNVSLGIYAEDTGNAARELIARFHAIPVTFSRVVVFNDLVSIRRAIDTQDVVAVLHIGPSFSRNLEGDRSSSIQILLDGRRPNVALVVQGYLNRIIQDFVQDRKEYGNPSASRTNASQFGFLVPRMWFNENLNPIWSSVPAILGIQINVVALLLCALSVARERELGTFEQLLVSPLRPTEILIGKTVPGVILGFGVGVVMIATAILVFRLPFAGSVFTLLGAMLLFLLATVGVGLFISSLAKTQQQAFLGAFTYVVPASILSGLATPFENIPEWLRWIAYLNPVQYMISVSRAMFLEGPPATEVMNMIWPLAPIALVTLTAAAWLFRKRME